MNHNSYITVKRAKFKTISGEVNIPYGTKLEVGGNVLLHNGKPVCAVFSDCAYEFFAQNDDGQGLLRGKLIQTIKSTLAKHDEAHQDRWDEYSARDCAPQPLKLSIHSGGIEHPCRCR